MICPECKTKNPENNRFCGACGAELPQAVAPSVGNGRETSFERMASIGVASQPPSRRTEEPRERRMAEPREISRMEVERPAPRSGSTRSEGTGVTGPSFLGLSDASEDYDEPGYSRPYGDDLYRSNWGARFLFALIVIGVVGGLGYMQLKSSHPLQAILGTQQATNSNGQQQNGSAPQANAEGQPSTNDNQNAATTGNAAASANTGSSAQSPGTATSGNNDDASAQNAAGAKGAAPSSTDDLKDKRTNSTTAAKDKTASADEKTDSSAGDKQASDANNKQSSASGDQQSSSDGAVSGKKAQSAKSKSKSAKTKSSSDDEIAANADNASANDSSADDRDTSSAAAPARAVNNSEEPVRQAEIYLEGKGVPQNCDEGLGILRAAEQRGNSRALVKLGAIYATGNCVPKDNAIAYHYFTRAHAVDPKNEWVEENRAILWANMTADERNRARAEDGGVQ